MSMKVLVIGGSGFLSGTLARTALSQGHQVWTITRGQRPETAPFLCHRIYDLGALRASGAREPSTPIEQGLREHVESLLA